MYAIRSYYVDFDSSGRREMKIENLSGFSTISSLVSPSSSAFRARKTSTLCTSSAVITSYSIHYTKLYESAVGLATPRMPELRAEHGAAGPRSASTRTTYVITSSAVITSYSIHYTKLYEDV